MSGLVPHPNQHPSHDAGGGCPHGIPRVAALLIFLLCCALTPATQTSEGEDPLVELEVAYIYNFTRFIQWPEAPTGRPFVIGVIGNPVMEVALRVLERDGKRGAGRRIEVRGFASADVLDACEILFVGADAEDQLDAIVRRTAGQPMLLVGDTPGYAGRGVAIELFRKPDVFRKVERLRFRINRSALMTRGLMVSAELYDVAEVLK